MTTLSAELREAIEVIEGWSVYAPNYFKEKHNLQGDLDRLHAALAAHDAQQQEPKMKPIAWVEYNSLYGTANPPVLTFSHHLQPGSFPVYTHPPAAQQQGPPQDAKDAARYRWLREHHRSGAVHDLRWYLPTCFPLSSDGLDAAIDEAMEAKK
jgi:hypothetical protein